MMIGEVIGSVWATRKDERLNGLKLMVVRPINYGSSSKRIDSTMVAADSVGAGVGDRVLIVKGSSASKPSGTNERIPVDATIVGIVDSVEVRED
ncbi:EutN/CcmL family microcompartment protein [Hathewaya limosa]|uniref:Ethanolamine utilization protein EutN n=1 Tax=Hathewaya limosa TaxID=1536 RepID=A0ABU0JSE2_HATLI|nr:EutN/CcmL family microcompartment protein [Hathewaya limosa]AWZ47750.1 ethanolamine utilization protein EutN [Clostridiaceae bacterium 14S0207]MDQ0479998.1 ethanolamine utilization protein EutN [Hathewaya limosa]